MTPDKKLPLFVVTGASCAGKTTACEILFHREKNYIVMESDILWNSFYDTPQDGYSLYRHTWMELCANISQCGLPCILCGCGTPEQFEPRPERALFSDIHYLAIVCDDATMLQRLERRGVTDEGWKNSSLQFNRWLRENAGTTAPAITLLDTSALTPSQAGSAIDRWICSKMSSH